MQCSYQAYRRVLTSYESNTGIVHWKKQRAKRAARAWSANSDSSQQAVKQVRVSFRQLSRNRVQILVHNLLITSYHRGFFIVFCCIIIFVICFELFEQLSALIYYCWFPHDVTKIQTIKLSILLRFYFHGVLEQLKTNFQTNFRFKRFLGFVIEF